MRNSKNDEAHKDDEQAETMNKQKSGKMRNDEQAETMNEQKRVKERSESGENDGGGGSS
jgi:hypothetical protein